MLTQCNVGIVSACLPTLLLILKTIFLKRLFSRVSSAWKVIIGFRRRRRKASLKSTPERGSEIYEISPEYRFDKCMMPILSTSSGDSGTTNRTEDLQVAHEARDAVRLARPQG